MATASDVPNKFDLVIDGEGYMFADSIDDKSLFGQTPTFVQRQNVEGDYGDNKQDFWMTFMQKDWSSGEGQKFINDDEDSLSRYWVGDKIDILTQPGSVRLNRDRSTFSTGTVLAVAAHGTPGNGMTFVLTSSTNLYTISATGTVTDQGAHGLGATPSTFGLISDSADVFMSTTDAGTVGVRKWSGASFSTFSATASDGLEFLNNTLFGIAGGTVCILRKYDTAGTATTVFTWQTSDGGSFQGSNRSKLLAYGGKLLILLPHGTGQGLSELWLHDGTAPAKIAEFPPDFVAYDMAVVQGAVFTSGVYAGDNLANTRGAVLYYAGGSQGELWKDTSIGSSETPNKWPLCAYRDGFLMLNSAAATIMQYSPLHGGMSNIATYTPSGAACLAANDSFAVATLNNTTPVRWPATTYPSSGSVTTSLIDYDSSLKKLFRGIKVEFDSASDGNGGSIDIAYRLEDNSGSFTTLQTGAVSGTEYTLSGVSGRSIAVKVTLNKGTSTSGPILKRIAVRAIPLVPAFKLRKYILTLGGRDHKQPLTLRDGTKHIKDGLAMYNDLQGDIASVTTISITDDTGTYTAVLEADKCEFTRYRTEEFLAVITAREA